MPDIFHQQYHQPNFSSPKFPQTSWGQISPPSSSRNGPFKFHQPGRVGEFKKKSLEIHTPWHWFFRRLFSYVLVFSPAKSIVFFAKDFQRSTRLAGDSYFYSFPGDINNFCFGYLGIYRSYVSRNTSSSDKPQLLGFLMTLTKPELSSG